jgi:hypothetical protein
MKIGYFAPSYKRSYKSITQTKYPFVTLIVKEDEADEYRNNGNTIETCPNEIQGNIARVRNYIIDTYKDQYDAIVIVDDDCNKIGFWEEQKYRIFDADDLEEFFESMYILTKDFGFKYFGLNCVTDKGAYREHTPFSTNAFIGAPCSMIITDTICRYDEEIPLKEDYDFTLQNLKKYGGALRANFASYDVKQAKQVGGCASSRTNTEEERQFNLLQKKWGTKIIQTDKSSKRKFDFNPILKSPIKGV